MVGWGTALSVPPAHHSPIHSTTIGARHAPSSHAAAHAAHRSVTFHSAPWSAESLVRRPTLLTTGASGSCPKWPGLDYWPDTVGTRRRNAQPTTGATAP